ncbi:hypothetical protein ASG49_14490 [Marmoricola sp. Leaf446]|uniref:hypothetical protein n=1 Tax=Marmoricola sp. Leaf446 TaxID=1736379 RepID=UPI0007005B83|nr:hypothetical protein [Marmoricola sp. Leaf446]KQT90918.1 hypothetical protein ASG49_14490 [Marmoricola sp. Leaf446]
MNRPGLLGRIASSARPRPVVDAPAAIREARLVGATRVAGVAVGLLAAAAVGQGGSLGAGSMLAPTVLGTCVLLAVIAGETLVRPRREPGVRSASLAVRRVRDHLPRTWLPVAVVAVLTAGLLVLTTVTAGPDPTDGSTRSLRCEQGAYVSSVSPYPGAYYAVPLALALVAVLAVAALAARQVVVRPRGRADAGGDDTLRRRSLRVVVAATGVTLGLSYVGVASPTAVALRTLGKGLEVSCAPGWADPVAAVLGLSVPVVMGLVIVCGFVVLSPGTPRR